MNSSSRVVCLSTYRYQAKCVKSRSQYVFDSSDELLGGELRTQTVVVCNKVTSFHPQHFQSKITPCMSKNALSHYAHNYRDYRPHPFFHTIHILFLSIHPQNPYVQGMDNGSCPSPNQCTSNPGHVRQELPAALLSRLNYKEICGSKQYAKK